MILYSSENIEIIYNPRGGDTIIAAFAPKNEVADGKTFWGQEIAHKIGISALGIMPRYPNWYPKDDFIKALPAIKNVLGQYTNIINYGQSMGAYAALKFAKAVNAGYVLAFSPQWSINPDDLEGKDGRFISSYKPQHHADMSIKPEDISGEAFVLFDPFNPEDKFNYRKIKNLNESVNGIEIPFTGHFPIRLYSGTVKMRSLLSACIEKNISEIKRIGMESRRGSDQRIRSLAEVALNRGFALAIRIYKARPAAFPPKQALEFLICLQTAAIEKNDLETAIFALHEAHAIAPEDTRTIRKIADLYQRSGNIEAAIQWITSCTKQQALDANLVCHLGGLYLEIRNINEAEHWLRAALEMNPRHVLSCLE